MQVVEVPCSGAIFPPDVCESQDLPPSAAMVSLPVLLRDVLMGGS